jgi:hypothetical protein
MDAGMATAYTRAGSSSPQGGSASGTCARRREAFHQPDDRMDRDFEVRRAPVLGDV